MGEAPAPARRAAGVGAHFRLPRRKLLVVRLGGGGTRAGGHHGLWRGGGLRRRIKLRWLRGALWRLAELCVAALSGPPAPGAALRHDAPPTPWSTGIEPYFVTPFVPAVLVRRAGHDYS